MYRLVRGFTLIEIIIVVVILGVLASTSLPRLTAQINKARAAEAFNVLGGLMGKVHECYVLEATISKCNTIDQITLNTGYAFPESSSFLYAFDAATCPTAAACTAVATALKGDVSSTITFSFNLTTGAVGKAVTGDFTGLSK